MSRRKCAECHEIKGLVMTMERQAGKPGDTYQRYMSPASAGQACSIGVFPEISELDVARSSKGIPSIFSF